ncbi:50S ribosomal protein L22 [Candidatus Woesearchaeota archaeon]|nr:50S ribosomal protein L22 [Candidatus Woesearchaeota archaeon]
MAYHYATQLNNEHTARAVGRSLPISTKFSVEICNHLRHRKLEDAKKILERVTMLREAIPMKRYTFDLGHKPGSVGPGRYPVKACKNILELLDSVEANAQFKGLNTSLLQIVHICAHKASIPMHGGRRGGRKNKRTHLEVVVQETAEKPKEAKK